MLRKIRILAIGLTCQLFVTLQAQTPIPEYTRQIHVSSFTWTILAPGGVNYTEGLGQIPMQDLGVMAENSMSKIINVCNFYGNVISSTRRPDNDITADMHILFETMDPGHCGEVTQWNRIHINNYNWRHPADGLEGYDLETTILHELVHAFLGSGHYGGLLMTSECNASKITAIDYAVEVTLRERYNPSSPFIVKNLFENQFFGGKMRVGSDELTLPAIAPGELPITQFRESNFPVTLASIANQTINGHLQGFDSWSGTISQSSSSVEISPADNSYYIANYRWLQSNTVQLRSPIGALNGLVKINDQQLTTPSTVQSAAGSALKVEIVTNFFELLGVAYTFSQWTPGNIASSLAYLQVSDGDTIVAQFSPRPLSPQNLSVGGSVGQHPRMTWTSHSAGSGVVEYQIWRKIKPMSQQEQPPVLLTTVGRACTTYTDNSFSLTAGYTQDLVSYDVRARYQVGDVSATANPNYNSVFAEEFSQARPEEASSRAQTISSRLSAQPNPFNPITQIFYDLTEPAHVQIDIYDAGGRKVAHLAQGDRREGQYSVPWNGALEVGVQNASGVYYCRMMVRPDSGNPPYQSTIRLLLLK